MLNDLLYVLLFVVTLIASYGVLIAWWPDPSQRRLSELQRSDGDSHRSPLTSRLASWQSRFSQWLLHISPWVLREQAQTPAESAADLSTQSPSLRLKLLNAGLPSPQALVMFQVLRMLLALLLPLCTALLLWWTRPALQQASQGLLLILASMVGYGLPHAWLERRIRHRQTVLFQGFPDALDLMRMCIQAGLGLDATLERVGREIRLTCPPLSEELAMTGYELQAGASRAQALRHLADRIGMADVEAWVNTLIQSDRFGTSLSESLEVYSEALRNKRKLVAQEAAAKLPIKLLIPLVFCLFPGLLTVLLGPAVINIMTHLMPVLTQAH
jgi:tight adherence protein C